MTIPQPTNLQPTNPLDSVVMVPPNDNTDGQDCPCGHAGSAHQPVKNPEAGEPSWQCLYCACTRANPAARVPSPR
jgi:hypothetical protein